MAEKSPAKKKSTTSARQQMLDTFAETAKAVDERKDADARPEDRLEARTARDAVTAADALSTDGVVKSIGELRSTIGKTLAQLSDRLKKEVGKYMQLLADQSRRSGQEM